MSEEAIKAAVAAIEAHGQKLPVACVSCLKNLSVEPKKLVCVVWTWFPGPARCSQCWRLGILCDHGGFSPEQITADDLQNHFDEAMEMEPGLLREAAFDGLRMSAAEYKKKPCTTKKSKKAPGLGEAVHKAGPATSFDGLCGHLTGLKKSLDHLVAITGEGVPDAVNEVTEWGLLARLERMEMTQQAQEELQHDTLEELQTIAKLLGKAKESPFADAEVIEAGSEEDDGAVDSEE
ncbi:MAG: hypothetical protein M1823_005937 [Watsoniomyces obsoletus]|nr:MAG: hypothetical protein M1823_005937 [Watsoniomyces obsoletus]